MDNPDRIPRRKHVEAEVSVIVNKIRGGDSNFGYNAATGEIGDLDGRISTRNRRPSTG